MEEEEEEREEVIAAICKMLNAKCRKFPPGLIVFCLSCRYPYAQTSLDISGSKQKTVVALFVYYLNKCFVFVLSVSLCSFVLGYYTLSAAHIVLAEYVHMPRLCMRVI